VKRRWLLRFTEGTELEIRDSVMHIHKIAAKNFRLLKDVELVLEPRTTLIVGRNNSGKTSLAELFRRLLIEDSPKFQVEDFSLGVHDQFWTAFSLKQNDSDDIEIRSALPIIEVTLTINYANSHGRYGPLGDFVIDLNPDCDEALIVICYQLQEGKINALFEGIEPDESISTSQQKEDFFRIIKDRIPKHYKVSLLAVDPNDPANKKPLEWSKLRDLLQSGFITAQRGLDDASLRNSDVLGKILETLFNTAMSNNAAPGDQATAQKLEAAVLGVQGGIDKDFNEQLTALLPAFELFGYPGLPDPEIRTETVLDVSRLLKNHTRVCYSGSNGIHLPEAYNGLGMRNLIFILLKLLEFFKSFQATQSTPGVYIVFIEEPEAHLHPQMQEVFIGKLSDIADVFAQQFNNGQPWPVQFVVTTHSSHMANRAPFRAMRYFLATSIEEGESIFVTKIKDLRGGLSDMPEENEDFLHQYMTLTRCDLFFADKAILIEGPSERLLLPKMIEKIDQEVQANVSRLGSQYVSVIEVGGAYAHLFFDLLSFLELRTLIITDLDAVNSEEHGRSCKVSEGTRTSNACIKAWFGEPTISPSELLLKSGEEKTIGIRCIAYQVPEVDGDACGRSFEAAFILANKDMFNITRGAGQVEEDEAWNKAREWKKTEFALTYAIYATNWSVPRYIAEGLRWLAGRPRDLSARAASASA
jgi:putative ATP-dependent endonuclease of the OLD family